MINYEAIKVNSYAVRLAEADILAKVEESRKGEGKVKWGLKRTTEKKPQMRPIAGLSAIKAEDIAFEMDANETWLVKFLGFRDELVKVDAKASGFIVSALPHQLRSIPDKFKAKIEEPVKKTPEQEKLEQKMLDVDEPDEPEEVEEPVNA